MEPSLLTIKILGVVTSRSNIYDSLKISQLDFHCMEIHRIFDNFVILWKLKKNKTAYLILYNF